MLLLKTMTAAEMDAFETECFRNWLNRIDATIGYDKRFATGSVATWRMAFDEGHCEADAIKMLTSA